MRSLLMRGKPALMTALVLLAAGSADAHAVDDIITCVWEGPTGGC